MFLHAHLVALLLHLTTTASMSNSVEAVTVTRHVMAHDGIP